MASTLDARLYNGLRDTSLSASNGPPPTKTTPMNRGLCSGSWASKNNIWQTTTTTPRMFDSMSNDGRQRSFPDKDKKVAVTDVSKTVAGVSQIGSHHVNTATGEQTHGLPASATLSNRPIGTPLSPTRLRSGGNLGGDTGAAMTNSCRPSLLAGSAPDAESSTFKASSSAFTNRQQGSNTSRSFRHFNVEDAEEFVPSYLYSGRLRAFGHEDSSRLPSGSLTPSVYDLSGDISRPPARPARHPNYGHFETMLNVKSDQEDMLTENPHHLGFQKRPGNTQPVDPNPHSIEALTQRFTDFNFTFSHESPTNYQDSNLRPDVASYRPSNSTDNVSLHSSRQNTSGYPFGVESTSRMLPRNMYPHDANQNSTLANSAAFNMNSSTAGINGHGSYNDIPQHPATSPNTQRFDATDFRQTNTGNDFFHRSRGHLQPKRPEVKIPDNNTAPQYYAHNSTNAYAYQSNEYGPELSRMGPYQQSYNVATTAATSNYFPDDVYAQESESNGVARSELLEEFRAYHKSKKYELKDIYGYVVEFSGDQAGSRFIQTKLEQANSDEKEQIFSELQTNARQLMSDVFGNYVIQKMFEYGSQSQKKTLASHMQGYILKLSLQPYGCRCVQKAFEHILTDQQASLIRELEGHVMAVGESQHGNHVIQKAIECIPGEHIQFIVDAHQNHIVRLARHTYGCRIIQRMLEYCSPPVKRAVLDELHSAIPSLIDDQFGNYVIQCIIKKCSPADRCRVIGYVQQRLLYYSVHKFASNVVEKAIQFADDHQRAEMARTLTSADPSNGMQSPVPSLLKDQYGNYVIQTVLRTIQGPAKRALADEVRHHLSQIGKLSRARQITAMADTLAAVTAGHSPSSISSGPQTPRTPTSLNSGDNMGTPMTKSADLIPPEYPTRDPQRGMLSFRPMHG